MWAHVAVCAMTPSEVIGGSIVRVAPGRHHIRRAAAAAYTCQADGITVGVPGIKGCIGSSPASFILLVSSHNLLLLKISRYAGSG